MAGDKKNSGDSSQNKNKNPKSDASGGSGDKQQVPVAKQATEAGPSTAPTPCTVEKLPPIPKKQQKQGVNTPGQSGSVNTPDMLYHSPLTPPALPMMSQWGYLPTPPMFPSADMYAGFCGPQSMGLMPMFDEMEDDLADQSQDWSLDDTAYEGGEEGDDQENEVVINGW